ncbi:copper amine oxidase N-terminal domain-containing protein [Paenibacillus xylaniclasticus]|uniref:copper amine oxidase N-terminal domain-containing protein n=1 Tax=Paenibacillus xylaniclasticus TaxID=588083 RepID=UPI000FD6E3CD|nr:MULTISPECIES: copper amine oxidase N-terminal domain-containing protein [Paenibacillus]GFN30970.1 hypothetical protein PCURB6_12300 [Paenibacillus curdlanolyticus]
MFKRIVAVTLATAVITGGAAMESAQAAPSKDLRMIPVIVNGKKVRFPDTEPYINTDGYTMVPIRFVSEKLGAQVKWNNTTQTAIIIYKGKRIEMSIGSKKAVVDGEAIMLDTTAEKYEGRTMVPLRFVSEVLNSEVKWDNKAHSVRVTDAEYQQKVDSGKVKLDPWGREYSKNWSAKWIKLSDLEETRFYSFYRGSLNREFIADMDPDMYKRTGDILANKIREWYAAQMNVDYRTVDENKLIKAFIDNAYGRIAKDPYYKREYSNTIKEYVKWVKKNKVIVQGYADPELSTVYGADGQVVGIYTRFKFKVTSAIDTSQVFMDSWNVSPLSKPINLQKGVWYDGYSIVTLDTIVAYATFGEDHGLSSFEHMYAVGDYFYDVVK